MSLEAEVARFRQWAATLADADRTGDWEAGYPFWQPLWRATDAALSQPELSEAEAEMVLLVIARDREEQWTLEKLKFPDARHNILLAEAALRYPDRDARWQIVDLLETMGGPETHELLRGFARDEDEYVRRRAVPAVAKFDPGLAERLALEGLTSRDPHSRLMAFRVLFDLGSAELPAAIEALRDDENDLVKRAVRGLIGQ